MRKSKKASLDQFAQQCTHDSLKTFSRSFDAKAGLDLKVANLGGKSKVSMASNETEKKDNQNQNENSKVNKNQYSSTFISIRGGSQEVAAVVANMDQPDFSDSFIGWLQTVNKYPRAFDFKYESLVSILDINMALLFAYSANIERKVCNQFTQSKCKFGFTLDEFELKWRQKLAALKFAITIYLREPNGLTQTRLFIEKGNSDCRFNILNYLSPFWREITQSGQEFHVTFNLNADESEDVKIRVSF